jgi:hypothetical protein
VVDSLKALDPKWPIREADIRDMRKDHAPVAAVSTGMNSDSPRRTALAHRWLDILV